MSPEARRAQIISAAREVFLRHGFVGTRVRDIAEQAGITENLIYIRFSTKAEIYEAAVTGPLDTLASDLVAAIGDISDAEVHGAQDRRQLLERFHRVLLANMLETAPLLAVALFSEPAEGRRYYREVVLPRFSAAVTTVIADVTGWPAESMRLDVLVESLLGLHFGLALDSIFDEHPVDVDDVARQLSIMFAPGLTDPAPHSGGERAVHMSARAGQSGVVAGADTPASESRSRMPAAQRRADIARAAREVFVERGPAGARTKEIAERAGITEAFMFRVFNGKDELYHEAIEQPAAESMNKLRADIIDVVNRGHGVVKTLSELVERSLTALDAMAPVLVVALFSEMVKGRHFYRQAVLPVLGEAERYLTTVPGWGRSGVEPSLLWQALFGIQFGTVVHHLLTGEALDTVTTGRRLIRLVTTGIR